VDATDPGFTDPVGDVDVTILNGSLGMTFNVDVVVSDQAGLAGVKRIVCNVNYTVS